MSEPAAAKKGDARCQFVTPPELVELAFARQEDAPLPEGEIESSLQITLGFKRFATDKIGVLLTAEVGNVSGLRAAKVVYRVALQVGPDPDPKGTVEERLLIHGAHTAPRILYPYMREALVGTLVKAGFPPGVVPPIIDFGSLFDVSEFRLPAVSEPDAKSSSGT